jgi:AcrR family transcriptional regulator
VNGPRPRNAAATRADLLTAARLRFLRDGYDRTNVRDIAADVGVNVTLIFRYFGTKEGLFDEATVTRGERLDVLNSPAEEVPERLLASVLRPADAEVNESFLIAMLRSASHEGVATRLREGIDETITQRLADLVGGEDAHLRAELVSALIIGIGVLRHIVGQPAITSAAPEVIEAHARTVFDALLTGRYPLPETGGEALLPETVEEAAEEAALPG